MSLNGIGAYTRPLAPRPHANAGAAGAAGAAPLQDGVTTRHNGATVERAQANEVRTPLRAPLATTSGAATALPVAAPAGTDPELWSVLSAEERSFFARSGATGPLTYGRAMTQALQPAAPPSVRGGRLDIRA